MATEFTWSERKRSLNLKEHGLDFVDAITVFQGLTFTFEDDRFSTKSSDSSLSDCSLALLSEGLKSMGCLCKNRFKLPDYSAFFINPPVKCLMPDSYKIQY